jgi:hypothetical protein
MQAITTSVGLPKSGAKTDVAIVSTARFLIRLVGLMPSECDAAKVANDIENLIKSLPKCAFSRDMPDSSSRLFIPQPAYKRP